MKKMGSTGESLKQIVKLKLNLLKELVQVLQ